MSRAGPFACGSGYVKFKDLQISKLETYATGICKIIAY